MRRAPFLFFWSSRIEFRWKRLSDLKKLPFLPRPTRCHQRQRALLLIHELGMAPPSGAAGFALGLGLRLLGGCRHHTTELLRLAGEILHLPLHVALLDLENLLEVARPR